MNRKDYILKLIVQHFIKTAEPVGSKTLISEYGLDYSSATIRAEMNALEVDGYLEKTHTSSGRVPSSKGYQYYIDNLREASVDEEIKMRLQTVMDKKIASVEEVIHESCEILAEMTSLASIVLGPNSNEEHLVSVQIIPISRNSATAVFVTDQGYVENKTFVMDGENSVNDIQECVKLLNDRLKGTSISELVPKMEAIKPLLSDFVIDHDVVYQALLETFLRFASDRLELYGKDQLFNQPEFANDADKLKKIIELLDNPDELKKYATEGKTKDNVSIKIGSGENGDDVSVVSASLSVDGKNEGTISIVGPKRMDYDRVVSLLSYVSNELNKHFEEINHKGGIKDGERNQTPSRGDKERNSGSKGKATKAK